MTEITGKLSTALADRYRIERHVGDGGMATVYLAEDLKHKRQVAIKVLRPELSAILGAERFLQEIEVTANLQHPNILPLYDSGEAESLLYYVMPYVEGETLRHRMDREKQMGIDESIEIAKDVAAALHFAHQKGVVHRDIKPENILLQESKPLVADFGIALAVSQAGGSRLTETGLSLGTPHYMSPEQATGDRELDARSDVYSLGAMLYEMLVGEPPHHGNTVQAIVARILSAEPEPVSRQRPSVPPHVEAALRKALNKTPADRFSTAAKFADALGNPAFTVSTTQAAEMSVARPDSSWKRLAIGLATALGLMTAFAAWQALQPDPVRPVSRYSVRLPEGQGLDGVLSRIALSPDGSRMAYVGEGGNAGPRLLVRELDQLEATPLTGTDGALSPFFSPDGDRVGFFAGGRLQVASLRGGPPVPVADTMVGTAGGTWHPNGFIYLGRSGPGSLLRVSASGGVPEDFTTLDAATGETDHLYPDVLGSGKGLVFSIRYSSTTVAGGANIGVADVATGEHRVLVGGVYARYAASGHILYVTRDGTLMAVPFDDDALELRGEPTAIVDGVGLRNIFVPDLTISDNGTLAYTTGSAVAQGGEPVWVDRNGRTDAVAADWTMRVSSVALSPDAEQLAFTAAENDQQVWVTQLAHGTASKLTFEGTRNNRPVWTPDGRSVAFVTDRAPRLSLFQRPADGTAAAAPLHQSDGALQEVAFSPDGEWIVFRRGGGPAGDIYGRQLTRDSADVPLVATNFQESSPTISPDGRWLAYVSTETGDPQVYVRPFPNVDDGRWLVSTNGGTEPVWARNGRELFYRNGEDDLITAEVAPGDAFTTRAQQVLFSARPYLSSVFHQTYDVTPDGQRFLMIRIGEGSSDNTELIVVENFFEELKTRAGN
jgi:serine/threonine-protein kinase